MEQEASDFAQNADAALQVSSLNFVDARPYSRRQTRRFRVTTIAAMQMVAASSTRKFPVSVAWLITAPSPTVDNVCPLKMEIFGHDAGVPGAARRGDEPRDQERENPRQEQFPPALEISQPEHSAHFFQVRGNGAGAGDDIEQDVPLRAEQEQDHGADSHPAADPNQHQEDDRKQSRGGHGGGNLREGLHQGGKPRPHPYVDSHRE